MFAHPPSQMFLNNFSNLLTGFLAIFAHSPSQMFLYDFSHLVTGFLPIFAHSPSQMCLCDFSHFATGLLPIFTHSSSLAFLCDFSYLCFHYLQDPSRRTQVSEGTLYRNLAFCAPPEAVRTPVEAGQQGHEDYYLFSELQAAVNNPHFFALFLLGLAFYVSEMCSGPNQNWGVSPVDAHKDLRFDHQTVMKWIKDDPSSAASKRQQALKACQSTIFFPYCTSYGVPYMGHCVYINDVFTSELTLWALPSYHQTIGLVGTSPQNSAFYLDELWLCKPRK